MRRGFTLPTFDADDPWAPPSAPLDPLEARAAQATPRGGSSCLVALGAGPLTWIRVAAGASLAACAAAEPVASLARTIGGRGLPGQPPRDPVETVVRALFEAAPAGTWLAVMTGAFIAGQGLRSLRALRLARDARRRAVWDDDA